MEKRTVLIAALAAIVMTALLYAKTRAMLSAAYFPLFVVLGAIALETAKGRASDGRPWSEVGCGPFVLFWGFLLVGIVAMLVSFFVP